MSIWQNPADGSLHDDMDGVALTLSCWPQGMNLLTKEQATALQNPAPSIDSLAAAARAQRNAYLDQLQPLYLRHKSQLDLGGATTLTAAQFMDLVTLMEGLRNVPETAGFPNPVIWPVIPAWLVLSPSIPTS